jgi:nucleoside-diphosphate-sugar epimerase
MKAEALIGYTPLVQLEEGLRRTIEWCRIERARELVPSR